MDNWRLALIVEDVQAIRVAAAYYAVAKKYRSDLVKLSAVSGVHQNISDVIERLEATGVLGHTEPPEELQILINAYCVRAVRGPRKER